jgi:hypothetical protein
VEVEEQRIRSEARRGFQKHLLRFRRVELVLLNAHVIGAGVEDYRASFGGNNQAGLKDYLATLQKSLLPCAGCKEGLAATVAAIKANEAILTGQRVGLQQEWFGVG